MSILGNDIAEALNIRFDSDAGENITIRDYIYTLLITLFAEGESFSGKRPFGNSGWEYDLYIPLIKAGYISGKVDEYGYIEDVDEGEGAKFVHNLINVIFMV